MALGHRELGTGGNDGEARERVASDAVYHTHALTWSGPPLQVLFPTAHLKSFFLYKASVIRPLCGALLGEHPLLLPLPMKPQPAIPCSSCLLSLHC